MRGYLIAITLLVAPLLEASAQSPVADSGARIRITSVGEPRAKNGTLISLTPDTLVYHPGFLLSINRTPLDSIRSVERSLGMSLSAHNMIVGAGIGALVGAGVTAAIAASPSRGDGPGSGVAVVALGPLLVGAGLLAGGWIGAENRTEDWSLLYPSIAEASMIIGPSRHNGIALGLSVPYDVPMSLDDDDAPTEPASQSAEL